MTDSARISKNLSVLKGVAALIVMLGHYGSIPNFWVVVTLGMLVFSISSGYFTYIRYHGSFSPLSYWHRKITRLVPHLLIINLFLLCIFFFRKENNIWSIYTLVNIFGMNGILNWFHIQNLSPFGAGMWFLTLLILFYAFYPLMEKAYRHNLISLCFTVAAVLFFYYMHLNFRYGHALWMTASGFPIGMFIAQRKVELKKNLAVAGILVLGFMMMFAHFILHFDGGNFFFIIFISSLLILLFQRLELPKFFVRFGLWVSSILLELYLLHPYLKMAFTSFAILNIVFSMLLVLVISSALLWLVDRLPLVFQRVSFEKI